MSPDLIVFKMVLEVLVKKACWFLYIHHLTQALERSEKHLEAAFAQYFFWDNDMKILQRIRQDFEDCGSGLQCLNPTHATLWVQIVFEDNYINKAEIKWTVDLSKPCISTAIMAHPSPLCKCDKYIFKHRPL